IWDSIKKENFQKSKQNKNIQKKKAKNNVSTNIDNKKKASKQNEAGYKQKQNLNGTFCSRHVKRQCLIVCYLLPKKKKTKQFFKGVSYQQG
ncbi:hypothetical protein RFI_22369, partial [Reticulomyxa filosa]